MIFRTFDHYNNDLCDFIEEYDFCFICYEIQIENEIKPLKLNNQPYYLKTCSCDGFIHKPCLDKWYSLSQTCPICREFIIYKKIFDLNVSYIDNTLMVNNSMTHNNITHNNITFLNVIKKNILMISNYFMLIVILWNMYFIYDKASIYYSEKLK